MCRSRWSLQQRGKCFRLAKVVKSDAWESWPGYQLPEGVGEELGVVGGAVLVAEDITDVVDPLWLGTPTLRSSRSIARLAVCVLPRDSWISSATLRAVRTPSRFGSAISTREAAAPYLRKMSRRSSDVLTSTACHRVCSAKSLTAKSTDDRQNASHQCRAGTPGDPICLVVLNRRCIPLDAIGGNVRGQTWTGLRGSLGHRSEPQRMARSRMASGGWRRSTLVSFHEMLTPRAFQLDSVVLFR